MSTRMWILVIITSVASGAIASLLVQRLVLS